MRKRAPDKGERSDYLFIYCISILKKKLFERKNIIQIIIICLFGTYELIFTICEENIYLPFFMYFFSRYLPDYFLEIVFTARKYTLLCINFIVLLVILR